MAEQVMFVRKVGETSWTDVGDVGFWLTDLGGWHSGVAQERQHASPYAAHKSIPAPSGIVPPAVRQFRMIWAGDREDREQARNELHWLFPLGVDVEIKLGDADVYSRACRQTNFIDVLKPQDWVYGDVAIVLPLTLYDPAKYAEEEVTVELSDTDTIIDAGTLPSDFVLEFDPTTNPVLIVSEVILPSTVGDPLWSLPLTGTVGGGEVLRVDSEAHTIVLDDGVETNALDFLALGQLDINGNPARFRGVGGEGHRKVALKLGTGQTGSFTYTPKWE